MFIVKVFFFFFLGGGGWQWVMSSYLIYIFLTSGGSGWVAAEKRDVVGVSREKTKR